MYWREEELIYIQVSHRVYGLVYEAHPGPGREARIVEVILPGGRHLLATAFRELARQRGWTIVWPEHVRVTRNSELDLPRAVA
jgi:hypothetical protein